MKEPEIPASERAPEMVICFPVNGCEAARPMTGEAMEAAREKLLKTVKKHWGNEGVKAIIELLEIRVATAQVRCSLPGATGHDAGQAYGLQQFIGEVQNLRWAEG